MMSDQHHGDLWPFVPEFEADLSPGENLDRWREAEAFFAPSPSLWRAPPTSNSRPSSTPPTTASPSTPGTGRSASGGCCRRTGTRAG